VEGWVVRDVGWKVLGGVAGAAAGWTTRTALRALWRRGKGEEPPDNPASPQTSWGEALLWAAGSGVALAVVRLVAQRGAAEAWRSATGSYPADVLGSGSAA
jgi:hypothetical protein